MITYNELIKAMNIIERINNNQISKSLSVYESRNEYDGTIESAIECLTRAGYDFDNHCNNLVKDIWDNA